MTEVIPAEEEFPEMLESLQPPEIPDEVFTVNYPGVIACRAWHKNTAATLLGGLQTDPQLHANGVRLDWLLRLVLAKASGRRKPSRYDLFTLLNVALPKANVHRLEDPSEGLFCEVIVLERGVFRIFAGLWEAAGAYSQTLLDAFESLPNSEQKDTALTSVYALLRLSDEVAARSNVNLHTPSGGAPKGEIELPSPGTLRVVAKRVQFDDADLAKWQITQGMLAPYIIQPDEFSNVSDRPIGDTALEFHPLLRSSGGLVLISPCNVSTAIRSVLISTAIRGGIGASLQEAVLVRQERFTNEGNFWPMRRISLAPPNKYYMRGSICEYEQGGYLQVIQIPGLFHNFPQEAFASLHSPSADALSFLSNEIYRFFDLFKSRDDIRQLTTVLLLSGWGGAQSVEPPIDERKVPANWLFVALSFADAGDMGSVPDTKLRDVLRVLQQERRLADAGFEFQNVNGVINLMSFWRSTGGNLIPEHMLDIEPPTLIGLPTNQLLSIRDEAQRRRDRRVLPLPDGSMKVVERMEWSEDRRLKPIYICGTDALAGRMSAAVLQDNHVWWVEAETLPNGDKSWCYRIWHAALQWIEAVGGQIARKFPVHFPGSVRRVTLLVPPLNAIEHALSCDVQRNSLENTLLIIPTPGGGTVEILPDWLSYLPLRDNDAEVAFAAAIFECFSRNSATSMTGLRTAVRDAIDSADWRWLHAHVADRVEEQMVVLGLTNEFHPVPYSAHTLVKCGSVWSFRDRSLGSAIDGKDNSLGFIEQYCNELLRSLVCIFAPSSGRHFAQ
jgi:hypothetical protein